MTSILNHVLSHEPPKTTFEEQKYITTSTGNKVCRSSVLCGPQNIHLHGKTIVKDKVVIRGDLATIRIGRNCIIMDGAVIRPSYKRYKGGFAFVPLHIGEHVYIGKNSVIESANIGSNVIIGDNCVIGPRCILKDCTVIEDGTVLSPDTVVPPFVSFRGIPGEISDELPPSTPEIVTEKLARLYRNFVMDGADETF
jgi:dynactin 5